MQRSSLTIGVIAVVLSGTLATGVTLAASQTHGVSACANNKRVLRLLNAHGGCPHGFKKTTIGATGPKGKTGAKGDTGSTGPSQLYIRTRSNANAVAQTMEFTDVTVTDPITVPAGDYAVNAAIQLIATTATGQNGNCTVWAGPQEVNANVVDNRNFAVSNIYGSVSLAGSFVATAPTSVSVSCTSGYTNYTYAGTLSITAVGAISSS